MKAVRIPTLGPVEVIELAEPEDDDTTAFLASLYAAIGCHSVECVELTSAWEAWVDETGIVDDRPVNRRATLLGQSHGLSGQLYGDVVVTGATDDQGQPLGLTDDQASGIARRVDGLTSTQTSSTDRLH